VDTADDVVALRIMLKGNMMKVLAIFISIVLFAPLTFSQDYFPDRPPSGATGKGRYITQEVIGRIISNNGPVIRREITGQDCKQVPVYQERWQNNSSMNSGSILETIAGGIIGSQGGGAATDALAGNSLNQQQNNQQPSKKYQEECKPIWTEYVIGYRYTVQYQNLQMDGILRQIPEVGKDISVIVRSIYYATDGT
jgi:uncharacterized protein YcfJ